MSAILRAVLPYIIAALVGLLSLSGVYWYIRHQGVAAEREKQREAQMQAYITMANKADEVARKLEVELAAMTVVNKQLAKDLEKETNRNPIYRTCVVPAEGVKLLQQAIKKGK